jgi:hypothetical protein
VHFGIPRSIILYRDIRFHSSFWTTLWENMETKLNRSTTFHGKIEVDNRTLVQLLMGYNHKHPNTKDENLIYIQHSNNIDAVTSTDKSHFENFFE